MKKIIYSATAILFTVMLAGAAYAQSPAEYMNKGNATYRNGDYRQAIEYYEDAETENADLYYNLANAHFKNGEIGPAIVYYNRALRLNPRDEDARANLEYARLVRQDKVETEKEPVFIRIIKVPYSSLSMNESAALVIVLFTILISLIFVITAKQGQSRKLKSAALVTLILLVIQASITGLRTYNEKAIDYGVVTVETVTLFSAPSDGSDKLFELHEGAEVRFERKESGYILILLPTGWTGWLPESAVSRI